MKTINTMNNVKHIWSTDATSSETEKTGEALIAYIARVSNYENQDNPNYVGLLRYCLKNGHWSPFEMACMCVEIETSRAISAQIIRHRSFHFQEFSQRYSKIQEVMPVHVRRQDFKNRQNSIDNLSDETKKWFDDNYNNLVEQTAKFYDQAVEKGIAKECARFVMPMSSKTKLYMQGTLRDWIHYINLRTGEGTQLEHRQIALQIKEIFKQKFPIIAEACWSIDKTSK